MRGRITWSYESIDIVGEPKMRMISMFAKGKLPIALVLLFAATQAFGQNTNPAVSTATTANPNDSPMTEREKQLLERIDNLERRLAALEANPPAQASQTTSSQVVTAGAAASTSPAAPASAAESSTPSLANILGPVNVNGFVDTYYSYNLNQPHSLTSSFRLFDGTTDQFSLNMVELTVAKPPDAGASRLGYNLTFGFGNAMNVVNSASPGDVGFDQYLKEAYISYLAPVGKGLQIDFGKFVTPHGAEVIETKDNWNYSRGLLYNYAIPFFHFGLRAKYAFNAKYALTGYAVNGWNNIIDNNTGKTYGASFAWTPTKKWSVTENYMAGPELPNNNSNWRQLTDTVVTYSPTSKLTLMANYDYARGDVLPAVARTVAWNGIAGYIRYAFNDRYALATRYEYFDDRDGFNTGAAQHFNEFTGTFERTVAKHLITRWEYRRDMSNRATFAKGGGLTDHQDTFTGGLVYVFDMKELK